VASFFYVIFRAGLKSEWFHSKREKGSPTIYSESHEKQTAFIAGLMPAWQKR